MAGAVDPMDITRSRAVIDLLLDEHRRGSA
jgi:hypothetical protein